MFRKLWIFLTEDDYQAQSHNKGVLGLFLLIVMGLGAPLLWHNFVPDKNILPDEVLLAELKGSYSVFLDSIDSLKAVERDAYYKSKKDDSPRVYRPYSDGSNRYHVSPVIESHEGKSFTKSKSKRKVVLEKFNLNEATKRDLVKVRGIGDYYATRILKFRDKLGGFYSRDQLYEVYGLDSSVVEECFKYLDDSELVVSKKVLINTDSFKVVLRHPYLGYEDVKAVFKYRPLNSLKVCKVFPDKCENLKPYFEY